MPHAGKPILGIVGGIGSGKSHVARLLGMHGYHVIDSDRAAHAVYGDRDVIDALLDWYGASILKPDGSVDRKAVASRVFRHPNERERLERLIHPRVHAMRAAEMSERQGDPSVRGFVWDTPLLIEANLHGECDAILFIDVPHAVRLERVQSTRGWDDAELTRREANQLPLDTKRRLATHILRGDEDDEQILAQLRGFGWI